MNIANRNSLPLRGKNAFIARAEQTPRPTAAVVVWRREETRWVRRTARRTQASEPTLTAFGPAAERCAECAKFKLLTPAADAAIYSLRVRIHGEVCAECASLGL